MEGSLFSKNARIDNSKASGDQVYQPIEVAPTGHFGEASRCKVQWSALHHELQI